MNFLILHKLNLILKELNKPKENINNQICINHLSIIIQDVCYESLDTDIKSEIYDIKSEIYDIYNFFDKEYSNKDANITLYKSKITMLLNRKEYMNMHMIILHIIYFTIKILYISNYGFSIIDVLILIICVLNLHIYDINIKILTNVIIKFNILLNNMALVFLTKLIDAINEQIIYSTTGNISIGIEDISEVLSKNRSAIVLQITTAILQILKYGIINFIIAAIIYKYLTKYINIKYFECVYIEDLLFISLKYISANISIL